jgi:hypothetical protein
MDNIREKVVECEVGEGEAGGSNFDLNYLPTARV